MRFPPRRPSPQRSPTRWTWDETQSVFLLWPITCRARNHHHWCGSVPGISSSPNHMPNTKQHTHWCRFMVGIFSTPHHMPSTKPHPCWCRFAFGIFSLPEPHPCWCEFTLGSFPSPSKFIQGVFINVLYNIKLLLYIFNSIYKEPMGILWESRTRLRGTGIRRVQVRVSQKHPTGHPCPSLGVGFGLKRH